MPYLTFENDYFLGEVNQGDHKSGLDMFIIPGPRFKLSGLDLRQLHPIFFLGEASKCSTAMCSPELNLCKTWKLNSATFQLSISEITIFNDVKLTISHHRRSPRCSVLKHFQLSQLSASRCQSRTLRSNAPLQMRSPRQVQFRGLGWCWHRNPHDFMGNSRIVWQE